MRITIQDYCTVQSSVNGVNDPMKIVFAGPMTCRNSFSESFNRISQRMLSHMWNGFRALSGIDWKKNRGSKISWHCFFMDSLSSYIVDLIVYFVQKIRNCRWVSTTANYCGFKRIGYNTVEWRLPSRGGCQHYTQWAFNKRRLQSNKDLSEIWIWAHKNVSKYEGSWKEWNDTK
jgi:hypothetical protein